MLPNKGSKPRKSAHVGSYSVGTYILACHLQIDPDPAYHFDPDPAYLFDADPGPTFQFIADPDPQRCRGLSWLGAWFNPGDIFLCV